MTDTIAATRSTLCRILAEVLQVDFVHPQDGFFEAGGDSVLAVQVVARAREAGLVLGVRDLFDHQTAESLAAVIGAVSAPGGGSGSSREEESPLVAFGDDEFGEFDDVEQSGASDSGAEAEWETIT